MRPQALPNMRGVFRPSGIKTLVKAPLKWDWPLKREPRSRQKQQQELQEASPSPSPSLGPQITVAAALAFGAVAVDVFGPGSVHVLQPLDDAGLLLAQSLDASTPDWLWQLLVSDVSIAAGLIGWLVATVSMLSPSQVLAQSRWNQRHIAVLALSWLFFISLSGVSGDPWLVAFLKDSFHRARPSSVLSSFSFPSGHTTSATFLVASLLHVLVPILQRLRPTGLASEHPLLTNLEASWPALGIAWSMTATGRVLGGCHWVSDTLSGGLLGLGAASLLSMGSQWILSQDFGSVPTIPVKARNSEGKRSNQPPLS